MGHTIFHIIRYTRILLAKTLIIPVLTYGCEIYLKCNYVSKRKLNVVFNHIIRYIFGLRRYDRVSSFSSRLLGMSLDKFLQFRTLSLFSDILLTQQPSYLYERVQTAASNRSGQLINPRYSSLVSERQFFVNSTRLWNTLPRQIRRIDNAAQFKTQLKSYFSSQN